MSVKVFIEDNKLSWKNCEKLYLDAATADVNFVFDDDNASVPAHKIILSVCSSVFHTMFYGSLPEKGDIPIADASADAFKEFLQFFYLAKVKLTSENIFQVANLCKKYEVNDGLKRCVTPMTNSLSVSNICTGYAVALLLGMKSVIEFCEQEIIEKIPEILSSGDFLDCDHDVLDKIVELVLPKYSPSDIVDMCMRWAKAKCQRDNLQETAANLKAQLKDSIHRIPFAELDSEQFTRHIKTYKRFFVEDELEMIIVKKAKISEAKAATAPASVPAPRVLNLNRLWHTRELLENRAFEVCGAVITNKNSFTSNTKLFLKEFSVAVKDIQQPADHLFAAISLHNYESGQKFDLGTSRIKSGQPTRIVLPFSVIIEPNTAYGIQCAIDGNHRIWVWNLKNYFNVENDIEIRFENGSNMLTQVVFETTQS